jgi:hypothetical protein
LPPDLALASRSHPLALAAPAVNGPEALVCHYWILTNME